MLTRIRSFLSWTPLMWATGSAVDQLRTAALPDFQKIKWFFKRFIHLFIMFFYFTENLRVEYGWKTVLVFFFWKKKSNQLYVENKKNQNVLLMSLLVIPETGVWCPIRRCAATSPCDFCVELFSAWSLSCPWIIAKDEKTKPFMIHFYTKLK